MPYVIDLNDEQLRRLAKEHVVEIEHELLEMIRELPEKDGTHLDPKEVNQLKHFIIIELAIKLDVFLQEAINLEDGDK